MILHRLHGALFLLLGVVSLADGWRIAQQAREGANFDAIGPDRYLIALGAAMLATGLWRLLRGPPLETEATAAPDRDAGATSNLLLTLAIAHTRARSPGREILADASLLSRFAAQLP